MDDLISRAAAIEYLMTNMGWRDEDGYEVDDADDKRAIITDLVNGIPAVDAVPVVRCGKCKMRTDGGFCPVTELYVGENFFCAAGRKRRESDGKSHDPT